MFGGCAMREVQPSHIQPGLNELQLQSVGRWAESGNQFRAPNLHHTRLLAEAGRLPVIASGGVGSIEHVLQVRELPVWGVIVGRSLYEGTLDLHEAIHVARS